MILPGLISGAVNLFSGRTKEERAARRAERQQNRELKKLIKQEARQDVNEKLELLKAGKPIDAKALPLIEQVKDFAVKNKKILLVVVGVIGFWILWKIWLKMKTKAVRRRSIAKARRAIKRK